MNRACLFIGIFLFLWCAPHAHAASSDMLFSEIMYNPEGTDTKREWIEVINSGTEAITITEGSGEGSWRFNDGSNHTFTLSMGSATIPAGGIAIFASDSETFLADYPAFSGTLFDTVMSLNNTGDTLLLSADAGETFFSEVTYTNEWGGNGDGASLEKINLLGAHTSENWRASTAPGGTPGEAANNAPSEDAETETPPVPEQQNTPAPSTSGGTAIADPKQVRITELYAYPETSEADEFIELYNDNPASILLSGWKLSDKARVITLADITLVPYEYYAIPRSATAIALNNTNETVTLFDATGNTIDAIQYDKAIKGFSYSLIKTENNFLWTSTPTPNTENIYSIPNDPPAAVITILNNPASPHERVLFSATESNDPDSDTLSYLWIFEDNQQVNGITASTQFETTGEHSLALYVSDGLHSAIATSSVSVLPAEQIISLRATKPVETKETFDADGMPTTGQIHITEIFPNPPGADNDEWIELYNPHDVAISLDNWIIDDADGGSRPYTITQKIIEPRSFVILGKEETKLALNNTSDEVRLFNADTILIDSVLFDDVQENKSYSLTDDELWIWTDAPTPSKPNTTANPLPQQTTTQPYAVSAYAENNFVDISIEHIRELELGTLVRLQGTITALPKTLGKTYVYIADDTGGIQVYFSKQEWPQLALGDVVGVLGEMASAQNEARVKISSSADIVRLYTGTERAPKDVQTGDIDESFEGSLIRTTGQLIQKSGASWMLDDGTGEVRITFQTDTNIQKPAAKAGEWITVAGILSETKSGYRILPRMQEDIALANTPATDEDGMVLGASAEPIERFSIPPNTKPYTILLYLSVTTGAALVLFIALYAKLRAETKKRRALYEAHRFVKPDTEVK